MDIDAWEDIDYGGAAPQNEDPQAGEQMPELAKPKTRRAPLKKKPKLTLEHLEKPCGLKEVFDNFPRWFADGYKGKGHEVRDLRRLLELYQRWQPRVFPHGTYNQFETRLEKMSGTHGLKSLLQNMRQNLPALVDPRKEPQQQQDQDKQQQSDQQQQQQQQDAVETREQHDGAAADGFGGFCDIDDDELLAMQAEAAMEAAEAAVPEAFEAFDEHVPAATAKTVKTGMGSNMNTAKGNMRDWSDDDDDDSGLGFSRYHKQQRQPTVTAAGSAANVLQPGRAAAATASHDNDDVNTDVQLQQQKAATASKNSRLKRQANTAAATTAADDHNQKLEDLDLVDQHALRQPQQEQQDRMEDLMDDCVETQQQQQGDDILGELEQQQHKPAVRRQQLLDDDDDDDSEVEEHSKADRNGSPAASGAAEGREAVADSEQQLTGTHGLADTATEQGALPPLELLLGTEAVDKLLME